MEAFDSDPGARSRVRPERVSFDVDDVTTRVIYSREIHEAVLAALGESEDCPEPRSSLAESRETASVIQRALADAVESTTVRAAAASENVFLAPWAPVTPLPPWLGGTLPAGAPPAAEVEIRAREPSQEVRVGPARRTRARAGRRTRAPLAALAMACAIAAGLWVDGAARVEVVSAVTSHVRSVSSLLSDRDGAHGAHGPRTAR
jgi:hypothetical protein